MPLYSEALYRSVVLVDVARFTDARRTFHDQVAVHRSLTQLLEQAFDESGIEWRTCDVEDRGDGKIILVPPHVPQVRLADHLGNRLLAGLRRHNAVHSDAAAMQLRVALHAGHVKVSSNGKVSPAINFAARILDAPDAKTWLAQTRSALALIASEDFFRDVIQHEAAEPEMFQQISVAVKETSTVAWLRLLGAEAKAFEPAAPRDVLELLPAGELEKLRDPLAELDVAQLPTLLRRAAGPAVQLPGREASAWDVLEYLTDVNAGADGFPPALAFVELLARQIGDRAVRAKLEEWSSAQARRLLLDAELADFRAAHAEPVAVDSRLHLVVVVQHDGIDPDRFVISHWRQDDPAEWPPVRGRSRTARFDEIEWHVDALVIEAERAWRGHEGAVALEVVLPRALLNLPVHLWHKEHDSGVPRPLCLDYPIVVRSLERMMSDHWHRVWNRRWRTMSEDPRSAVVHYARQADPDSPHAVEAVLEGEERCAAIVLTAAPSREPRRGDELMSALRSGLPAVFWHRTDADPGRVREVVEWLVDEGGLGELPSRAQRIRRDAHRDSPTRFDVKVVQELVVMWDDPSRLLNPDELAG
ncbi:hypothetical protein LZ318_38310 [Saccharopolyspora indica]|uniref:VMAP-C domain-containing protein n=1 Tax=Saccharopolyspora indica TaxID=1229659 RepID=UPI0022EB734C|nr:hypothetical protein [Saccharopolyspora indica]MDA3642786.1 hypothetical protein [Saccharopolyspora indica]